MNDIVKKAMKEVANFNKKNRFRDCGHINNAIDVVLAYIEKQEAENNSLKVKLKQLKRTRDLLSENWNLIFNDNEEEDSDI